MMITIRGANPSKGQENTSPGIQVIVTIETIEIVAMIENIVIVMSNETIEIVENIEMIELTIEDAEVIEIIEIIVNIEIKDIIVTVENNKIARNTEITVNDVDHQKGRRVRKNMPVHKKGYAEVSLQKVPIERY